MVNVDIIGRKYKIRTEWNEFTNRDAVEIQKKITFAPENLLKLYRCKSEEELEAVELDDDDVIRSFPRFYGEIIGLCSNIPDDVLNNTLSGDRVAIYKQYLEKIVLGIMYLPQDLEPLTEFEWEGDTYYLPKDRPHLDDVRVGADLTALQFTEASDLEYFSKQMEGGKYEYAANIISVLCRTEEDKGYNEEVSLQRAESFQDLPLDIVFGVFFSLIDSMNTLITDTAISSLPPESKLRKQLTRLISLSSAGTEASSVYAQEITRGLNKLRN